MFTNVQYKIYSSLTARHAQYDKIDPTQKQDLSTP